MKTNRLPIMTLGPEQGREQPVQPARKKNDRLEIQARFERLWLTDPSLFDPMRNCIDRKRLEYTEKLIARHIDLNGKLAADLGCGSGVLSTKLRDAGAKVHAIDIATNALKNLLNEHDIEAIQDYLPTTSLPDNQYDLVICTNVIGYLDPKQHRLLLSELTRLVKPEGYVVCSTAVDINTESPARIFGNLVRTELQIDEWQFSYHRVYLRLLKFFEAPQRYARAYKDPEFRLRYNEKLSGLGLRWFTFNTSRFIGPFWSVGQYLFAPVVTLLNNNTILLNTLEHFCRFWWSDEGISHALCIGRRKPLTVNLPENESAREYKRKNPIWE
jgi:2-polyprenyl-3-methyl-5-hydroxy-6-metoxy-1,4-benzoquinol methylase